LHNSSGILSNRRRLQRHKRMSLVLRSGWSQCLIATEFVCFILGQTTFPRSLLYRPFLRPIMAFAILSYGATRNSQMGLISSRCKHVLASLFHYPFRLMRPV
jgi:hypothetical protein